MKSLGSVGETNMYNRSWIYVLPLTVLFALQATISHAQEAIGNVIKHSGAKGARVELRGRRDSILLRIADVLPRLLGTLLEVELGCVSSTRVSLQANDLRVARTTAQGRCQTRLGQSLPTSPSCRTFPRRSR